MSAEYDKIIYNTAIKEGFNPLAAKLIVAQARFESADYTSDVFKLNNNTSGMKFIGQPLATRGSLVPPNERTCGGNCNGDYYAKFKSIQDSASDKISRLYNITKGGVTPQQLKSVTDADEFANLLKKRGYYGSDVYSYARGLKAKLLKINIVEFVQKNKGKLLILGLGFVLISLSYYLYSKKQ